MQTAPVMNSAVLENRPVNLYSDLMLHKMRPGLADNMPEKFAGPDEFPTTPLWGVGQRMFFLHDGRTSDLLQAIQAHFSRSTPLPNPSQYRPPGPTTMPASEANGVINNFKALSATDKQAVLDSLRSL
jgi:Di-haem oxidoreductase, putative peroxidase